MVTAYPYATGKNPAYDAYKAQSDYQRQLAWQDAAFGQEQATANYQKALADLQRGGEQGKQAINTSMLSRGVFRSGETNRRQAGLTADVLRGKEEAQLAHTNAFGQIQTDLQRALTMMDLENEQRVNQALTPVGGGGGGGGSKTTTYPYSPYGAPSAGLLAFLGPLGNEGQALPPAKPGIKTSTPAPKPTYRPIVRY